MLRGNGTGEGASRAACLVCATFIAPASSGCAHAAPDSGVGLEASPAGNASDQAAPARAVLEPEKVKAATLTPELQGIEHDCDSICAHSRELKCVHTSQCFANCVGMATLTPCGDEISTFYRCLVKQPTARWQCDEDGVAAIRDGFCNDEQARVVGCMQQKAR
jgi:hypothetical protein